MFKLVEIEIENFKFTSKHAGCTIMIYEVVHPSMTRKCEYDPSTHEYKFRRNLLKKIDFKKDDKHNLNCVKQFIKTLVEFCFDYEDQCKFIREKSLHFRDIDV
jgi:hypothetical protein